MRETTLVRMRFRSLWLATRKENLMIPSVNLSSLHLSRKIV